MTDQADDVARVGGFNGFAFLSEQSLWVGEAQGLVAATRVGYGHVLFKDARADADEG